MPFPGFLRADAGGDQKRQEDRTERQENHGFHATRAAQQRHGKRADQRRRRGVQLHAADGGQHQQQVERLKMQPRRTHPDRHTAGKCHRRHPAAQPCGEGGTTVISEGAAARGEAASGGRARGTSSASGGTISRPLPSCHSCIFPDNQDSTINPSRPAQAAAHNALNRFKRSGREKSGAWASQPVNSVQRGCAHSRSGVRSAAEATYAADVPGNAPTESVST